jgi:hypothetical protein
MKAWYRRPRTKCIRDHRNGCRTFVSRTARKSDAAHCIDMPEVLGHIGRRAAPVHRRTPHLDIASPAATRLHSTAGPGQRPAVRSGAGAVPRAARPLTPPRPAPPCSRGRSPPPASSPSCALTGRSRTAALGARRRPRRRPRRARKDHALENLARLRRSALNVLRANQDQGSTRGKIRRAGWDDAFPLNLLATANAIGPGP